MIKLIASPYPINKEGYSTRTTQSILQYGVGAMVDFKDQTLMTAEPELWSNSVSIIHDKRLEKALDVNFFGMPGTDNNNPFTKEGISYVRFPEWYFCPVCRRFMPLPKWIEEHKQFAAPKTLENDPYMMKRLKCYKDSCDLVASNIITICENGHISDFPWIEWAHAKSIPSKEVCSNPLIKYRTGNSIAEGLQGVVVECENCKASATLKDAFKPGVFEELVFDKGRTEFRCKGYHPWKGTHDKNCSCFPSTKQRGDSSVYFSNTVSSIVIPINSSENTEKVIGSRFFTKSIRPILDDCDDEEEYEDTIDKKLDKWATKISEEILLSFSSVKKILWKELNNRDGTTDSERYEVDSTEFKYEEYRALSGEDSWSNISSEDFLREEMNMEDYDIPGVNKVVLVKKLREVRALIGFSRMKPVNNNDMESRRFVKIKKDETNWYPGYQVRGEGIFIQFDLEQLNKWAETDFVIKRREMILENFINSSMADRLNTQVDEKFVLLHTLAHLLLKQLSFECGYNVASLRERIYYNYKLDGDMNMAGILLYTASGDSEGTLGGLVRQGRSDSFNRIFKEAIDGSRFCSNDPVCITSNGQGRESLNLAACHSCGLIPETSCEQYNIMLDRALVIGTFEDPSKGFYSSWNKNAYSSHIKESKNDTIFVCDDGQEQTEEYSEIWNYIKEDTDDDNEKALFDELILKSTGIYEKPIYGGSIKYDSKTIDVDLIWKESHVLFFLSDNFDNYKILKKCGWKVFCLGDGPINVELFLESIKVE